MSFFGKIRDFLDKRNAMDLMYLDFSTSFGMKLHEKLLVRMKKMGITTTLVGWVRNWLQER